MVKYQICTWLDMIRSEMSGQIFDHLVYGIAVRRQEAVIITDGVEAQLDLLVGNLAVGVLFCENFDRFVFVFAFAVER